VQRDDGHLQALLILRMVPESVTTDATSGLVDDPVAADGKSEWVGRVDQDRD